LIKHVILLVFFLASFLPSKVSAQIEKGTVHLGIAGLPIVDVFNIYPDNKITGLGLTGQIGFFPLKNLYLGINPYYVKVKNRYPDMGSTTEETLKIYGINTLIAYYVPLSPKFFIYGGLSLGFGVQDDQESDAAMITANYATYPIFVVAPGLGIHYFITKTTSLNFNLPLINVNQISYFKSENFQTLAPTIGVGFFF